MNKEKIIKYSAIVLGIILIYSFVEQVYIFFRDINFNFVFVFSELKVVLVTIGFILLVAITTLFPGAILLYYGFKKNRG